MKNETQVSIHPLARFAATLCWEDVPLQVQRRAEDLWVDWFGSALAGQNARPVQSITRFALSQGPAAGPCEILGSAATSSPLMAAQANAAASHVAMSLGLGSACLTYSVACASSAVAIGEAMRRIQAGESQLVVAGGETAAAAPKP